MNIKPQPRAKREAPLRGEIWYVQAAAVSGTHETRGDRPALVVSSDHLNRSSNVSSIVYLSASDTKRATPSHVEIPATETTPRRLALCEQIHTVDHSRMHRRIDTLSPELMAPVLEALQRTLGLAAA